MCRRKPSAVPVEVAVQVGLQHALDGTGLPRRRDVEVAAMRILLALDDRAIRDLPAKACDPAELQGAVAYRAQREELALILVEHVMLVDERVDLVDGLLMPLGIARIAAAAHRLGLG